VLAVLATSLAAFRSVAAETPAAKPPGERLLLFVGSNTLGESAVPELVKAYLEQEKKAVSAKIEVRGSLVHVTGKLPDGSAVYAEIHATGSGDCFKSLTGQYPAAGDRCDIGMSSRVVKEEEADLMLDQLGSDLHERGTEPGTGCEHPVALDGLAIVVHRDNPLVRISFAEIADIYSRRVVDWKEMKEWKSSGGPEGDQAVVALRRKEPSGTLDFFKDKIKPAEGPMADEKLIRSFTSSRDLAREVAANPRAIGFIGESYAELPGLKRLQVYDNSPAMGMEPDEAVFPDRAAVRMGIYPLTRLVYLYTPAVIANPEVRPFIRFALSEAGQSIIADKGNLVKIEGTSNHITSWAGEEDAEAPSPPPAAGQKKARVILRLHGSNTVGAECAVNLAINYFMTISQDAKTPPVIDDRTREIETPEGEKALEHDVTCDVDGDGTPEVIEIRPTGSSDGFRDLNKGKCDVGMSSRPISAAERRDLMVNCGNLEKPAAQFALGLDALAIIVSKDNPVEKITVQQVRRIFLGETTNWSELGGADQPIRLHARPERSGTYKHFSDAVLLGRSVPAAATRHAENTLLAEIVAADPAGIGFVPGANVGPAKVLKVGHEGSTTYSLPEEEEVRGGRYPAALCRYVYFYVPEQKPESPDVLARRNWPIAREFAEMSQNWRGQAIIASSGFITETTTLDEAGQARRIAGEPIKKYLERLRTLEKKVRLRQIKMTPKLVNDEICPQLLFGFNQDELTPESRNLIDKKLGPWLEMYPEIAKGGLVAEGWADSVGSDEACLKLSLKRAQNVADYISKTHRCKVTATGKGKSFDPPNTSEENKQRNRRVTIKRAVASAGGSGK
jgi:ABC-type phosphate transport system substrate-binding protein